MAVFLFLCNLLIPTIMLLGGLFMRKCTPGSINGLIGYRTRRSMKSPEAWFYAHQTCGRLWIRLGLTLLILSAAVQLPFLGKAETLETLTLWLEGVQLLVLLASIYPVEKALKENFNEDGKPKAK